MKRSLIIGMGIGQLYKDILLKLGHEVVTVDLDLSKCADYTHLVDVPGNFDTVHICTPNFTHQSIAEELASRAGIIFVEKPGFESAEAWHNTVYKNQETRIMMVKNNMWRDNIDELRKVAHESERIELNWINKDRVPNPGTWFTTKELAYGGVSKDLMPHLLSLFAAFEKDYINSHTWCIEEHQNWELKDLTRSDYGVVQTNGTYDVDDFYKLNIGTMSGKEYALTADWRSMKENEQLIRFYLSDDTWVDAQLGLCPEDAYERMIVDALANKDNDNFWDEQYNIDMWIHEQIAL